MTADRRPTTEKFLVRPPSFVFRLLPYLIALVAFLLRIYRLPDQNIWWDEGWSVWLSQKDLAWIALRTAMDEHPPLHYWFLHFWNFIAGTDAFAGRFVSVAFGVLTIALIYRIGKRVGGAWIGILAALFLTTARFHIWWSQDIKNYTPSILFAFAAVWFALNVIASEAKQSPRYTEIATSPIASRLLATLAPHASAGVTIGYALFATLAMWTHYLAALVLLALNLYWVFVILSKARGERRDGFIGSLVHWLIGNTLAAALFAPWLYLYLQNAAAWTAAPTFDFALFLKLVATVLPLGVTTNIDNYAGLTIALTTLVALGCIPQKSNDAKHLPPIAFWLLPTLIVAFPPLLVYALSLTPVSFFAPKIQARYLLILLPAYTILLARGIQFISRLSRPFAVFAFLALLAANASVLNDYYAERRLTDEYATLANTINSFVQQGDVVLLDTDQEWPTLLYYLRYPLDWLGVPNGKAMTDADADALVRRALNRSNAVWLVAIPDALATDPQKLLEARLARELPKQLERTIDDKRLVLYATAPRDWVALAPENFAPQYPRADQIDLNAQLIGYDLPTREPNAGDTLRLVTYWRAEYPAMVSVRIAGLVTATLQMPRGNVLRYENDFVLPPTARGEYAITVNQIELARIQITPRQTSARAGNIAHRVDYRLGEALRLIGYDLPVLNLKPNETLNLKLFWRAERAIEKNYTVFVHVVGEQFNPKQNNPLWGQVDRPTKIPTTAWLSGEIVREEYAIRIDADAPPGKYTVVVGMYDAATGARLPVDGEDSVSIGEIEIK